MNNISLHEKKEKLYEVLKNFDSLAIAFSGGADSSFLLACAFEILGKNSSAFTAVSPLRPSREKNAAIEFAGKLGVRHVLINSKEMEHSDFLANTADRCYICKKHLFNDFKKTASDMGITSIAHGANIDDLEDFRPGFEAAREMDIAAPMVEAELTKDDIRTLSKEMGLSAWNRPAMACLATRIPYGTEITERALKMVEQSEDTILSFGFRTCRVRHHGSMARIEIEKEDFEKILDEKTIKKIAEKLRTIGFAYSALDMEGYEQGKMNRVLRD